VVTLNKSLKVFVQKLWEPVLMGQI